MLRILSLLLLPLWFLPFHAAAERSALDLESEAGGSEEPAAAQAGDDGGDAKKLMEALVEALVLQCVLSKSQDMGNVGPDRTVEPCRGYKSLKDLLQKQSDAKKKMAEQSALPRLLGRNDDKLIDIESCLKESGRAWPALDKTFKDCKAEKEGQLEQMENHFASELDQCSKAAVSTSTCVAAECLELEGQMCPEGTACECYSEKDSARAAKYGVATWATLAASKLTIGALLGFAGVVPGGPLVAAGAVYAFPTGDSATVVSVSAAMSKIPACGCQVQPCKMVRGKCAVVPQAKSSNRYAKLPPLGFKCALERDACAMKQCEQDDMKDRKVGGSGSDVFNCNPEFLQYPDLATGVENNAANRNRHYHDKKFELPA